MVPMCNRAFEARLDTGMVVHDLPANDASGTNIHGFGWQAVWEVAQHSNSRVVMVQRIKDAEPYSYTARFSVSLDESGVTFDLSVTQEGSEILPYGIGFHPWFPADNATRISLKAGGEVYMREGFRPVAQGPVRAVHEFSTARAPRLAVEGRDTETAINFTEWDGRARIDWPNRGKSLTILASPNLRNPVLWSPVGAEFVCIEPQSHAVGAQTEGLIRALAPLTPLARGQGIQGTMRLMLTEFLP